MSSEPQYGKYSKDRIAPLFASTIPDWFRNYTGTHFFIISFLSDDHEALLTIDYDRIKEWYAMKGFLHINGNKMSDWLCNKIHQHSAFYGKIKTIEVLITILSLDVISRLGSNSPLKKLPVELLRLTCKFIL
jgi:hypothetical protein